MRRITRRILRFAQLLAALVCVGVVITLERLSIIFGMHATPLSIVGAAACLTLMSAMLYVVASRRLSIGHSRHWLLKHYDLFEAASGPAAFFCLFTADALVSLTSLEVRGLLRPSLLMFALAVVFVPALRFALWRLLFTPQERAEIATKRARRSALYAAMNRAGPPWGLIARAAARSRQFHLKKTPTGSSKLGTK